MYIGKLRLFEISDDPNVFLRNDRHQRLAGLHNLSRFHRLFTDDARYWRLDTRVLEIQPRLIKRDFGKLHTGFGRLSLRSADRDLLRSGFRGLRFGLCLLQIGLRLRNSRLSGGDFMFSLQNACLRGFDLGMSGIGGPDCRIVLLLRNLIFRDELFHPLEVTRIFRRIGLCFAHARLG